MMLWKKIFSLCLCVGLSAALPPVRAGQAAAEPPASPAPPARPLRHLLIGESVEAVQSLAVPPNAGFVVAAPGLAAFDIAELARRLAAGENHPIEERLLAAIAQVIENFVRQNEYPAASAIIPTQNIADGAVRVIVLLGPRATNIAASEWKIRNINMQGTRWFSESLLREKLRIEQGGMIRFSELDQAISWTNNNPFRRVKVQLDPVPNTGEADLTIAVQEALPLRLGVSLDNTGNEAIGKSRYTASVNYGNLWGLDHQIAYQFITTDQPRFFKGHGLDYRVPLPWRHYLQFSASYLRARPEFYEGEIIQNGETITSDLRYTIPLRTGDNPADVYVALNFKQSNNNLTYGIYTVQDTKTDIFQITTGTSMVRRDGRGAWAFGGSITASPGGINSRNTDTAFDASRYDPNRDSVRFGAKASYVFGNVSVQRLLNLVPGWDLVSRGVAQVSQANLLPSEQLWVGGSSTVRGFNESILSGDHGFVASTDLMGPAWKKPLPHISKTRGPLEVRPLVFFDVANTSVRHRFPNDARRVALASAGFGVRMSLATNFSLSADYGWQITYLPYPVEEKSRGHIRATLSF